jgi:hypothetical protein
MFFIKGDNTGSHHKIVCVATASQAISKLERIMQAGVADRSPHEWI